MWWAMEYRFDPHPGNVHPTSRYRSWRIMAGVGSCAAVVILTALPQLSSSTAWTRAWHSRRSTVSGHYQIEITPDRLSYGYSIHTDWAT